MMRPLRFACTRLYTLNGGIQSNLVVDIHPEGHYVERIYSIGMEEHPFTEWLGGTIILSNQPYEVLSYYTSILGLKLTIHDWIDRFLLDKENTMSNQPVYACHINSTSIDEVMPARLL